MPERSIARWVLLDGNRNAVAGVVLAGIFLFLAALGYTNLIYMRDPAAVRGAAGGLIPGLFTFLSIVLTINQLVLSQEFGSADEIRERVEDIRAFRHDVEERTHTRPGPVLPTAFLAVLVDELASNAAALRASASGLDPAAADEVTRFADVVADEAATASERLQARDRGRVNAVLSVLQYGDSRQLYEARRLRADRDLTAETREQLDELIDLLELFSVARTHFRTTYTQRVLARLSRILLYVGIPALIAVFVLNMLPGPEQLAVLARFQILIVSGLLTISLVPLAILAAYLVRIATVSERTISVGPFVSMPGSGDRAADSELGADGNALAPGGERTDDDP